jgi:hypothetical protein
MKTIAGVTFPCIGCQLAVKGCRKKVEIMRAVFFAIGNGKPVNCSDYEEIRWRGIEGVRP